MNKVSIIMPCFNDGHYMEEAVSSVTSQTYPAWELVIVDDGSDDPETLRILARLEEQGYTVLHTDHLGVPSARNAGIAAASGTYILPLDSDDRIDPNYLQLAVPILDAQPQVGIVYCHADLFGASSGPWNLPDYSLEAMLVENVIFVTALFRKSDWELAGGYCTTMTASLEDYDFFLSILELERQVVQLPQTLFHYRIRPGSLTARFVKSPSVVKETYRQVYQNHPRLYERYREEYTLALRDAFIDQSVKITLLEQQLSGGLRGKLLSLLRRFPKLKLLLKKWIYR